MFTINSTHEGKPVFIVCDEFLEFQEELQRKAVEIKAKELHVEILKHLACKKLDERMEELQSQKNHFLRSDFDFKVERPVHCIALR